MSAPTPVLAYRDATLGYGSTPIVTCPRLVVAGGEFVGLVGPNGAGKSTLLRAVTGDAALMSGRILLDGQPLAEFSARDRARIVAVVPQQVIATFSIPAADFVSMGRHPHLARFSSPGPLDREAVERAMRLTDTTHLAAKSVDALSGGDLQRLALAQALAQEPRLLLLDEATSHLDLNHRLQVLDLMADLVGEGMAVLAVFHDLDLAARYSDRVAVVSGAGVGSAEAPEHVITADMLRDVFGVRAVVGVEPVTGSVTVTPVLREGARAESHSGRVLVIGGSGVAAPLLRRLVLGGWEVAAGALNAGDADAVMAEALGIDYVKLPPFAPMDEAAIEAVSDSARAADVVIVCDVPFGHGNVANLAAAVGAERSLLLVGDIAGRDFTAGEAEGLWSQALASGAHVVRDAEGALAALAEQPVR